VYDILKRGSEEAQKAAAETLKEVKASMRINYFEDGALINDTMKKYM
jgi:tryptophanyl-tRNA synthetase